MDIRPRPVPDWRRLLEARKWSSAVPFWFPADGLQLKMMRTMDPYRTYIGNQDEAQKTFQDMFKKVARFVTYIDVRDLFLIVTGS